MSDISAYDFRREWAHAYSASLKDAHELAQILDDVRASLFSESGRIQFQLKEDRERLEALAQAIPNWLAAAEARLQETTVQHISAIDESRLALIKVQNDFLEQFTAERKVFEQRRSALDEKIGILYQQEKKLENARREFNSMPLWRRVFKKM